MTQRHSWGLLAMFAMISACGGRTVDISTDGGVDRAPDGMRQAGEPGPTPGRTGDDTADSSVARSLCERIRDSYSSSSCSNPAVAEPAFEQCLTEFQKTTAACEGVLRTAYESVIRHQLTCDDASSNDISTADTDYAICMSGGKCSSSGGGAEHPATVDDPQSLFMDSNLCQCVDRKWDTVDGRCTDFHSCGTVCCTCPGTTFQYTAAACDLSAGTNAGTCPPPDHVCDMTRVYCVHAR